MATSDAEPGTTPPPARPSSPPHGGPRRAKAPEPPTFAERASTWADAHRDDLVVAAIFAAARILMIVAMGVRMDLIFLGFAPHEPDLGLLKHRLLETIWYEHTQPPGFPALVGLLLKLSPFPDGITFQVAYLAMGLALVLVLRRIAEVIGLGRAATFAAIGLVVLNPGLAAIEFSASYDQPTILLTALFILGIARYASTPNLRHLTWVTTAAAGAVMVRTVYHPAWYLLVVAGLLVLRRPTIPIRPLVTALAVPGLLIGVFVVKNQVLYGEAALTTWGGPSLSKIAGSAALPPARKALIADGTVSPLFGRYVFGSYDSYADAMPPCTPKHPDIPVLAQPLRPMNGSPNLNYECFLPVYRQQGKDARAYLKARPGRFFGAQLSGGQMFFEPTLRLVFTRNQKPLHGLDAAWRFTIAPRVTLKPLAYSEFGGMKQLVFGGIDLQPTMVVLDLAVIAFGLAQARLLVRGRRRSGGGRERAAAAAWAAMGLTSLWVTVIGSLFEINENARYRLLIEPYLLLAAAWFVQLLAREARARWGHHPTEPAAPTARSTPTPA